MLLLVLFFLSPIVLVAHLVFADLDDNDLQVVRMSTLAPQPLHPSVTKIIVHVDEPRRLAILAAEQVYGDKGKQTFLCSLIHFPRNIASRSRWGKHSFVWVTATVVLLIILSIATHTAKKRAVIAMFTYLSITVPDSRSSTSSGSSSSSYAD